MVTKRKAVPADTAKSMSDQHKQALAAGREQGRAIRRYLEALESHKPGRRRKRPESIQQRLDAIEKELASADPLTRLQLVQERMDLQAELEARSNTVDLAALEAEFVAAARDYAQRKGISYAAWREAGVDPNVLKRAGIARGSDQDVSDEQGEARRRAIASVGGYRSGRGDVSAKHDDHLSEAFGE